MSDGIDPELYPEPGFDCPSRELGLVEFPVHVPTTDDPLVREGLWIVVYRDDGSISVVDAPEPARSPVQ